jgi:hypothetical protein
MTDHCYNVLLQPRVVCNISTNLDKCLAHYSVIITHNFFAF